MSTRGNAHQGLGYFSYFVGTHPSDKHLHQSFSNVRFIATAAVKRLGVELAFPVVFAAHVSAAVEKFGEVNFDQFRHIETVIFPLVALPHSWPLSKAWSHGGN